MRLTDLLATLAILAVLAASIVPKIVGGSNCDKGDRVRSEATTYGGLLDRFRLDGGRYPTTAEGLNALAEAPDGLAGRWDGPYTDRRTFADPWGRPYVYRSDGRAFTLTSWGMDGVPDGVGDDADIVASSTGNATGASVPNRPEKTR